MFSKKNLSVTLLCVCSIVGGAPAFADHHWDGTKASFGLNMTTGNNKSTASNGEFDLDYKTGLWATTSDMAFQYGKDNGVDNKEQYSLQAQVQRSFNNNKSINNYLYINGNYQTNKYTAYRSQASTSIGYGRDWIKTKKLQFSTQIGPAYTDTLAQVVGAKHDSSLGGNLSSTIKWDCFSHGALQETLNYTTSKGVNTAKSVTSYTDNIDKNFALNLSYTLDYVSKIPAGSDKTQKVDTTTSVNLVYSF
jgi:putative salt-induced outer membrane protein YdiY